MGLLKRTEYENLLELLKAIPDYDDQQSRRWLKRKLPSEILDNIEDDGAPGTHFRNILRVVDTDLENPSRNGVWPIITLVENAIIWAERFHFSPGINNILQELNMLHTNLQERAVQKTPNIEEHIISALISAFPTRRKLELFVIFSLNWDFENFSGRNLLELTANLVNYAIEEKKLIVLIDAAIIASPHDPYIRIVGVESRRSEPIAPPLIGQRLNGLHIQQLSIALSRAFIFQELRDLVQFVLDKKLEELSLRDQLTDVVIDLILYSERTGTTHKLINAALALRPNNLAFNWFLGKTPQNKPESPLVASPFQASPNALFELRTALVRAFSHNELKHFVLNTFGRELDLISLGNNLNELVTDLIGWTIRQGVLDDLLDSAQNSRPKELAFQLFPEIPSPLINETKTRIDKNEKLIVISRDCLSLLRKILVEAFTYHEISRIVYSLGYNLETIILGNNLDEVVLELVLWAERRNLTKLLFNTALSVKPENPSLLSWASSCLRE